MASMRDIKRRKKQYPEHRADYQSHEAGFYCQAAEARQKAEKSKPYFDAMYQTVQSILERSGSFSIRI